MSIIFFSVGEASQVGEAPRRNKLVSSDNFAVITTPGYLNNSNTSGKQLFPTDVIDVIYNYLGSSNFNAASGYGTGTFQQFVPVFNSGVITLQPVGLLTQTVVMNQAQVQGAYAAPVLLVPAAGAGTIVVPTFCCVYTNFQTSAFSSGGVGIVQWGATVDGAGTNALSATVPAAEITASSSQIYSLPAHTSAALTGISNAGLYWSNQTGSFAGGNAASTVTITLNYNIIAASV
jgi:hypothetical protein